MSDAIESTLDLIDNEIIREWKSEGFVLHLWDTFKTDSLGKSILAYRFFDNDQLIFEGKDYCVSPCHSIDGDRSVAALLSFLSLGKRDTDREYFDNYTPAQIEWRDGDRREQLAMIAFDMEENGTDGSDENAENESEDNGCDQCAAVMIQGIFSHETGCPNSHKVKVDGVWVKSESDSEDE